jgi:hypothetical protein
MSKPFTIEFHIPASPTTPSFFSQIGMFALSLRELGPPYSVAPIHVSIGHTERLPIPVDYYGLKECRDQLRWHWVTQEEFAEKSIFAQGENRFRVIGDSEFVCMSDPDTLMLRRFDELLQELRDKPAVAGAVVRGSQFPPTKERTNRQGWEYTAQMLLGRSIAFPCRHTFAESPDTPDDETPFCPNFGFVIAPRELMCDLRQDFFDLRKKLVDLFPVLPDENPPLMHFYSAQIALALAIAKNQIPWKALPMRYNWPNASDAARLYPKEIPEVRILHYLRRTELQRDRIFCERESFEQFLQTRFLEVGNQLLQERIRKLTNGVFLGP